MLRKWRAMHEAGHALAAHLSQCRNIQITFNRDEQFITLSYPYDGSPESRSPAILAMIVSAVSGVLVEYLFVGGDKFWQLHTPEDVLKSNDLAILLSEPINSIPKEVIGKYMKINAEFLCNPILFGGLDILSDRIIDGKVTLVDDDVLIDIIKEGRLRTPEYDVIPLIDWIMENLK